MQMLSLPPTLMMALLLVASPRLAAADIAVADREAPEAPRLIDREAPQAPRLIDREAPQAPRLIDREAPEAPRLIDREAPEAPRLIDREAPQAPRFIDRLEGHSSGFMLQPVLSGATAVSSPGSQPFLIIPSLRLGYMNRLLAVLLDVSYLRSAAVGGQDGFGSAQRSGAPFVDVVTVGADVMPYLWQSMAGRARFYLLGGFNLGAAFGGHSPEASAPVPASGPAPALQASLATGDGGHFTGGLSFGVGGEYFMHPRFALGVELGSRTQFFRRDDDGGTETVSTLYAGLLGTFIAGR